MKYPKRLIEVDLPIKRISAHARREKSIRHGHISTLHIWWARRPLASCRAVICAALWPDPVDDLCPQRFRDDAHRILVHLRDGIGKSLLSDDLRKAREPIDRIRIPATPRDYVALRRALLDFIAEFANWDLSTNHFFLDACRALTQSAHESLGGAPGTRPLVVDPFAGGGSIPLEALRVGADAFASDLNPVAVLLNKVVLEYIPKYGQRFADEVRKWGQWVKEQAEKELAEFYPKDKDGATPIAYLWARRIKCEGPGCGVDLPLIRSLCLSRSGRHNVALRILPRPRARRLDFEIVESTGRTPAEAATVSAGSATCPLCGFTTPAIHVRKQLSAQRGGAAQSWLYAVCADHPRGRLFRVTTPVDHAAFTKATEAYQRLRKKDANLIPNELINPTRPHKNTRGLSAVTRIGCETFGDIYNPRQALAIVTLFGALHHPGFTLSGDSSVLEPAVKTAIALAIDRAVSQNASLCRWDPTRLTIKGAFSKQALAVVWDYAEANPFSEGTSNWDGAVDWVARVIESNTVIQHSGTAMRTPASALPLPTDCAAALVTDPPYYAAIPYGDLSEFFYVWLRRHLRSLHPDLFETDGVDKTDEMIVTDAQNARSGNPKDNVFFRDGLSEALGAARQVVPSSGIGVIVYAEGTTAGWEAALGAIIDAGWIVVSSWPIDTEMVNRTRAQGAASLQSSVHIVCRPRDMTQQASQSRDIGDWRDVLSALPRRIHEWLPRLADEGVVGADAIFACLGPALEIFSRYSRVEKASGEKVELRDYLEQVWAAIAKEALDTIFKGADTRGFEQDARMTAIWFWVMKAANGNGNGNGRPKGLNSGESDDYEGSGEDAESSEPAVTKKSRNSSAACNARDC